jgi:hypothetical protein
MLKLSDESIEAFRNSAEALELGCDGVVLGKHRYMVTDDLTNLIIGHYAFYLNPLPILRKGFPNFKWEFHELFHKKNADAAIKNCIMKADFFWFPEIVGMSWDIIVTARRIGSPGSPYAIIGQPFQIVNSADGSSQPLMWEASIKEVGSTRGIHPKKRVGRLMLCSAKNH